MLEALFVLCGLIWLPIFLHQITHRTFLILLIWLCIAPVATNLANGHIRNPFFTNPQDHAVRLEKRAGKTLGAGYKTGVTTIALNELLAPTRTLFVTFLIVFFLDAIAKKKRLDPLDKTEIWMIIFSLIVVASALLQSKRLAWALRHAADSFIVPFLGYYVTRRLVTSEDRFRQLVRALGYMGFYVIIICVIERVAYTEVVYRLHGPFYSQANLSIALVVAFCAVFVEHRVLSHKVRSFVLYLTPVIIFLTWLRAAWVGFLLGIWVFIFLGYRLSSPLRNLHKIGLGLIILSILGIGMQMLYQEEEINERITDEGSVSWRLLRWDVAIRQGVEHPVFGIGLTNLQDALGNAGLNYTTAHSSFLTFFAEHGISGLLAYLAIVMSIVWTGLRLYWKGADSLDRWRGVAVIAVLVAHHAPALFYNELHSFHLGNIYTYVFVGGIAGLSSRYRPAPALYTFSEQHQRISSGSVL